MYVDAHFWLTAALGLWNVLLTIGIWLRKPGEDAERTVKAVTEKFSTDHAQLSNRMTTIEERTRNMPTDKEMGQLTALVKALESQVEGQSQTLQSVRESQRRIEDYLLNNKD